jgi:hypothetical protein
LYLLSPIKDEEDDEEVASFLVFLSVFSAKLVFLLEDNNRGGIGLLER